MGMVGAGSGLGPFMGFLHERRARKRKGEVLSGNCWLVFGCRGRDTDYLVKDVLVERSFYESQGEHSSSPYSRAFPSSFVSSPRSSSLSWRLFAPAPPSPARLCSGGSSRQPPRRTCSRRRSRRGEGRR